MWSESPGLGFIYPGPQGSLEHPFCRMAPCSPLLWLCKAGVSAIPVVSRLSPCQPILPFLARVVPCHPPSYPHTFVPYYTILSASPMHPSTQPSVIHAGNHAWATNPLCTH